MNRMPAAFRSDLGRRGGHNLDVGIEIVAMQV